jgi:GH15 family glucan-1,4-alpha-glucosidase
MEGKGSGIWEVRGEPQHFVYSKVMCWVALDRAIALADLLHASDRVDRWKQQREEIWETVVRDAWSEEAGAFTQYIGSSALDASNLMMAIVGFLSATDPRMLATINAIEERLTDDRGLVYRYRTRKESTASPARRAPSCSAPSGSRRHSRWRIRLNARAVFQRAAAFANDLDLLAEEVDPQTGDLLGNFPQAFSHIGLELTRAFRDLRGPAAP